MEVGGYEKKLRSPPLVLCNTYKTTWKLAGGGNEKI